MLEFIQRLYQYKPDDAWVLIWLRYANKSKGSIWLRDLEAPVTVPETADVYIGCGLSPQDLGPDNRCPATKIVGIPGLWVDIDYAHEAHQKQALPPDLQAAILLATNSVSLPPSLIVHSGHGIHAWWLFKEVWTFDNDRERSQAASLVRRLQHTIKESAKAKGWAVDSTHDLSRVLRIPGTLNHKSNPPTPVTMHQASDKSYIPDDFEDILLPDPGEHKQNTPEARGRLGDQLVLSQYAMYDPKKWAALAAAEPLFQKSFYHARSDFKDTSPSSYDLSIATYAAQANWSDQEIADLIIACRRHNDPLDAAGMVTKAMRHDYIAATILRAKGDAQQNTASNTMDELMALRGMQGLMPEYQERLRDVVGELLGVSIKRVVRYVADPPTYMLETGLGAIHLGEVGKLISQLSIRRNVAAVTGRLIPRFKDARWDEIAQSLLDLCEDEDTGPESTEGGQTRQWVSDYVAIKTLAPDAESAVSGKRPMKLDGKLYLFGDDFRNWLRYQKGEQVSAKDLGRRMRLIGFTPKPISVRIDNKVTSRNAWVGVQ